MHAAVLGLAIGLVGVKVGWEPSPDRSVVYVIQLDAGDLARFQADAVIESDIPPQVKNVRQVRIELATLFSMPPVQQSLPKEEPPRAPLTSTSSYPATETPKGQTQTPKGQPQRPFSKQAKPPSPETVKTDGGPAPRDEKKGAKGREAASPEKSEPETKGGTPRDTAPHVAAASNTWLPLTVALCASLGANGYFFWMWMEARARYRGLLRRRRSAEERPEGQQ